MDIMEFFNNLLKAFIPMFVAVDVIGVVPFFIGLTEDMTGERRSKLLKQSVLTATLITIAFMLVGKALFAYLRIEIYDFMIAGGAVIFIISTHDLISTQKTNIPDDTSAGVVPLATPLLAGPAVLATALITMKPFGVAATLISVILNFLIAGLAFHYSKFLIRLLGRNGARALSKIMALVLGAYGIMMIRSGIIEIISKYPNLIQ
ncbi:MAG: MarC family protein [bacterium]